MLRRILLTSLLAAASTTAFAAPEKYDIDNSHTQVIFSWNHFGFSNPSALAGKVHAANSISTPPI